MSRSTLKDRSAEHVVTGTQTLNSSAIYPIVCLLLYTSQTLALYQPEARADRLCD